MRLNIGWALNTKVTHLMDYSAMKYLPQNGRFLKSWAPLPMRYRRYGKKYILSGFRPTIMNIAAHRLWKYIKALIRPVPQPKLRSGFQSNRQRTYLGITF